MPIYEYRCDSCGFQKEHLQKMSDPQLTTCPECGQDIYLVRIEPAAPSHEVRIFACAGCGYSKEVDVQFRVD